MAAKDAERENDGPAMISIWRISMIDVFNNNHNKYIVCYVLDTWPYNFIRYDMQYIIST
jgi:hypothetical protein